MRRKIGTGSLVGFVVLVVISACENTVLFSTEPTAIPTAVPMATPMPQPTATPIDQASQADITACSRGIQLAHIWFNRDMERIAPGSDVAKLLDNMAHAGNADLRQRASSTRQQIKNINQAQRSGRITHTSEIAQEMNGVDEYVKAYLDKCVEIGALSLNISTADILLDSHDNRDQAACSAAQKLIDITQRQDTDQMIARGPYLMVTMLFGHKSIAADDALLIAEHWLEPDSDYESMTEQLDIYIAEHCK